MPQWVISKIEQALNDRCKAVNGSRILVIGVAYKKDTNDTRESPAGNICLPRKARRNCFLPRPVRARSTLTRKHVLAGTSISLNPANIANQDCVLICTDHSDIEYEVIRDNAD